MDWPVTYERKIRYSDTDAQGIVFNANYARYFDDTLTDLFDLVGFPWGEVEIVLRRMEIDFHSTARLGDVLVTGARVERVGKTSLTVQLATWDEDSGRQVAEARQVQVTVSGEDFRPVPVPEELIQAIEAVQGVVER
jgi:acyl-CoA thioester hydrolase